MSGSHIILAKEAETRKDEIEKLRNLPNDIMHRAKLLGLEKMWATKECGGCEKKVSEVTKVIFEMSYYNASLAWVVSVTNCSSLITGFIDKEIAKELFNNPLAMIGGFAGPAGIAEIVDGGLHVSGKWSWGSGISHCTHIVGGVKLIEEGIPKGTGVVFFTPEEVVLHDNWHVIGLKGTHSIDYSAKDVFIPEDRWAYFPVMQPIDSNPLYRFSFLGALSLSIAAVGIGLARRALLEIKQIGLAKSPFGVGKVLAERPIFQESIGELEAIYSSGVSLFNTCILNAESEVEKGACNIATKADIRLVSCHVTNLCEKVVREAYRLAGGSAIWQNKKLEEIMRDMNVITQHGMVNKSNYRTAGAVYMERDVPEVIL